MHFILGCAAAIALSFTTSEVVAAFGQRDASFSWNKIWLLTAQLVMVHVILSIVGLLICRDVAVRLSRGNGIGFKEARTFFTARITHVLLAPLIPVAACLVLAACHWASGGLTWLPAVGNTIHVAMSSVILLLMAVLSVITVVAWPLMLAVQSVEQCDCFDGLSRGFNFLLTKPMRFTGLMLSFALAGLMPLAIADAVLGHAFYSSLRVLFGGIGICMFFVWTMTAFLHLRREIDAIETDEVHFDQEKAWEPVPLSGKMAHPVAER
ncbi:MAG: hypothetical protein AB8G99_18985 [Planctomycetaceae bacterium]